MFGLNVLFITSDDMVYGFGNNSEGCLGLGHNSPIPSPELIPELCHQNIQYFVNGMNFVIAVNAVKNLYGFGTNTCGQLGRNPETHRSNQKPELIPWFTDKNVVQISCAYVHVLALTGDGRVFSWGGNSFSQLGCGHPTQGWEHMYIPIGFQFEYPIQSVYCYTSTSFVITSSGHVLSWGDNSCHQLGHNISGVILKPKAISTISGVKAITSTEFSTIFHTTNGLYLSGLFGDMTKPIKSPKPIPCKLVVQQMLQINSYIGDNNEYTNYNNQFIESSPIGSGGFGTVFKVTHKLGGKIYAVKRLQFADSNEDTKQGVLEEVNSLSKLDSDFVVKYEDSYLESNHLYIQMQFYSQSLRTVLIDKAIVFGRQPEDQMTVFEYFTSCEIFKELLECVKYLHESDPPVIHRNLKPENILFDPNFTSNRCVKLCDFGLAIDHNIHRQTVSPFVHTVCGTFGYIAPEVLMGKQYDHKSDIYSLSIIGEELFGIDLQDWKLIEAKKLSFKKCIQSIYGTLLDMMSTPFWRQRPECREVLAKHNEWSIDKTVVTKQNNFHEVFNTLKSNDNSVFYEILFRKTQ
ncbi:unnamed protein product [Medioppia subpectinata]|uniref:Protein kinase domain-containing protein n=1 Tax=Medioppia subpectinata TaxID=1979941 RepID=A0A7R9LBB2_9ACAR|nr:unnamed protein product [Medioppia subpectinata]CAG2117341.1 unnamed protein product [Medioppia subpectinata]